MQLTTPGRIVHFIRNGDEDLIPCAAIIVYVSTVTAASLNSYEDAMPLVNLIYYDPDGHRETRKAVSFSERYKPGCWSWAPGLL